jgi:polyribonucleotide nucleotidyltransferase
MLNYNFPPFSVGEIGSSSKGPGRREIGHGALAEKALAVVIPSLEEFPYVIRVVSEILSSNGSSSMASVCAGTLSLLDAGVPIKKPVAGIAMGLMVDEKTLDSEKPVYKILTDIQGPEDHHGDMDFKVAGTYDGINAIQLDVKFGGLNLEMIKNTLAQAKKARIQILDLMTKVISRPKPISSYAPVIEMLKIDPEQIGKVIGAGGKVINALVEKTGVLSVDIEDDGRVFVSADNREKALEAKKEIELMTREIKIGDIVEGKVVKILDFGAIVDIGGGRDGMIHVSELKNGYVKNVEDVLHVGDFVQAKVINVDLENNKISLSLKQLKA